MTSPWDAYFEQEREWINSMFALAPPPVRADEIKEAWIGTRPFFARDSIEGRLMVYHDLGVVPPILFEQIKYGDTWVIEAEGVIVERIPAQAV